MPTKINGQKVDLRALIQSRKAEGARPTTRETICLDPDLLSQLNELEAEKAERDRLRRFSDDAKDPDGRMGRPDPLAEAIAELQSDVAARSVIAIFRVPTRARQAEFNARAEEDDVDVEYLIECFAGFFRNGEPIPESELGRQDFSDWCELASRGEIGAISSNLVRRSLGTPDFPSSVTKLLGTRR